MRTPTGLSGGGGGSTPSLHIGKPRKIRGPQISLKRGKRVSARERKESPAIWKGEQNAKKVEEAPIQEGTDS